MGYYKTTGIVLRRMNLGEADRIMTILTREHGKVRAVAKGVRRIKSRMAGHLEPFGTVELMFADGRNLDIITSARLSRSGDVISTTPQLLAYAFLFAEMIDRLVDEGVEQAELYQMVEDSLIDIEQTGGDAVAELFFKLRLLDTLGYHPRLDSCTLCGAGSPDQNYFFIVELGGIVDQSCARDQRLPLSLDTIKLWRLMLSHPLPQVRRIGNVLNLADGSLEAINTFYDYTFGRRFTTNEAFVT